MTVLEFVDKYSKLNSAKAKEEMVKSIVKRTYCPILEKRIVLENLLNNSASTTEFGLRYIDMFVSKLNYTLSLIIIYTDLELDLEEDSENKAAKVSDIYDGLINSGLLEQICVLIGEKELKELTSINEMLINNFYEINTSPQAIISEVLTLILQLVSYVSNNRGIDNSSSNENESDSFNKEK